MADPHPFRVQKWCDYKLQLELLHLFTRTSASSSSRRILLVLHHQGLTQGFDHVANRGNAHQVNGDIGQFLRQLVQLLTTQFYDIVVTLPLEQFGQFSHFPR